VTYRDAVNEFNSLVTRLLAAEIALDINTAKPEKLDTLNTRVTWATANTSSVTPLGYEGTIGEYCRLLGHRQFSALLLDGALLQLSQSFERDDLVQHRYVYIPCPVSLAGLAATGSGTPRGVTAEPALSGDRLSEAALDASAQATPSELTYEEGPDREALADSSNFDFHDMLASVLMNELHPDKHIDLPNLPADPLSYAVHDETITRPLPPRLRARATLRFDYDPGRAATDHPGAHLHFCGEGSRWPTFGPLSVGHFVRFVFRHHYPDIWAEHEFLRQWPIQRGVRCITQADCEQLFVDTHV